MLIVYQRYGLVEGRYVCFMPGIWYASGGLDIASMFGWDCPDRFGTGLVVVPTWWSTEDCSIMVRRCK